MEPSGNRRIVVSAPAASLAAVTLLTVTALATAFTASQQVAPDLLAEVKPGDVVFVFARPPGGAGPPVAAKRISLSELPMTLTLTDADSPMPAMKLSAQASVRISARLSRSGAVPVGPGDLEAEPREARVGDATPVALVISKRLP